MSYQCYSFLLEREKRGNISLYFNSFRQNCIKYCTFEREKCIDIFNDPSAASTGKTVSRAQYAMSEEKKLLLSRLSLASQSGLTITKSNLQRRAKDLAHQPQGMLYGVQCIRGICRKEPSHPHSSSTSTPRGPSTPKQVSGPRS